MANGGGDRVFLDTNILVCANIAEAPFHHAALKAIETHEQAGASLWVSRQVLREYLAVLTRPKTFIQPIPADTLSIQVRSFADRFHVTEDSVHVTERLLALMEQFPIGGKQIHDANIVATMQVYDIKRLVTHNMRDFDRFSSLITILPLEESDE